MGSTPWLVFLGVSVHVSNAAPKSETRNNYRDGRGGANGSNRGAGPEGPMYQQRFNGPTPNAWANQSGPRGNIDMPNLQALGEYFFKFTFH